MKINTTQFAAGGLLLLAGGIDAQQNQFLRKIEPGAKQQELHSKKPQGIDHRSGATSGLVKLKDSDASVISGEIVFESKKNGGIIQRFDNKSPPNEGDFVGSHLKPKGVATEKKIEANPEASMKLSQKKRREYPMTHSRLDTIHQTKREGQIRNRILTSPSIQRRLSKPCNGLRKIVQCKGGVPEEVCKKDLVDAGVEIVNDMHKTVFFAVCVESEAEADIVNELTDIDNVEDDPERTLSYLPESKVVRHLQAGQQVIPYGVEMVRAPEFWDKYNKKGEGIKVCIIDTGTLATHEDLKDGEHTGTNDPDLVIPWDEDGNTHGTHCAGVVAAQDNSQGVIGVAPSSSIHTIRIFDNAGQVFVSDIVEAMSACAEAGANIISMSLGGPEHIESEAAEIIRLTDLGILVVAAAGNEGDDANPVEYPAGYDSVMGIGAVDAKTEIASFSTYNSEIDVAAPGVDILSTTSDSDSSYSEYSGTSMATPHVAAIAALLWSQFPDKSVDEIRNAIQETARDVGACGKDRLFGHGMVDVMAAADFLENNSNAAAEITGCIDVEISILTDDYGSETTYAVSPRDGLGGFVYRGGPYPNGLRVNYTDNFKLESGCYDLIVLDSYGDGFVDPQYGVGEIRASYNGIEQVAFNSFEGASATFTFGSCGEDSSASPVPQPDPIPAPVESVATCGNGIQEDGEECDDGNDSNNDSCTNACRNAQCGDYFVQPGEECDDGNNNNNDSCRNNCELPRCGDGILDPAEGCDDGNLADGDGCDSSCNIERPENALCDPGQSLVEFSLETDRWSLSENELYFYDDAADESSFLWSMQLYEIRGNSSYDGTACIDPSRCHKFFFFDSYGDGLTTGGLTLKQDGATLLDVGIYDIGTPVSGGGPKEYWYREVGSCRST